MLWLIFLILASAALGIKLFIYSNDDYWPKRKIPFVKGSDVGSFWDRLLIRIPFHTMTDTIYKQLKRQGAKLGGIMEFRRPIAVIMDLELIKNIMVKDFDHFVNRRPFGSREDLASFGRMLFNMENQEWKDTRSAMSPTFTTGKMKRMHVIFNESAKRMVEFLKEEINSSSSELDLRDACSRYTMDIVASTAFGVDSQVFSDKDSMFSVMANRVQKQLNGYRVYTFLMSLLLPGLFKILGLKLIDQPALKFFSEVTMKTIEHRKKTGERREDFLQLLLDARDGQVDKVTEEDEKEVNDEREILNKINKSQKVRAVEWTDELILAQSILFFAAGFDAMESLLIYALYELALNPHIQERLSNEIDDIVMSEGGLSYENINQNEYMDMVVSETMRRYTPAARAERICTKEYQIPGTFHKIPQGQVCQIPIYGLHHDPEYYPEPEKFIPERFTAENRRKRNPYTYLPFGHGPRNCIAMRYALIQGKCAIAHLVHHFKVEPCSKTIIPMEYNTNSQMNMKPLHGMWLKLSPRK